MKFFMLIVIIFLAWPALAQETKSTSCTLENKEFCGQWNQKDGMVWVTGGRIVWDAYSYADCSVIKEGRLDDGRPVTLLKCIETPDRRYSPDPTPFPAGYFLEMQPRIPGFVPDNDWVKMFGFHRLVNMTDPCFSDRKEAAESCDLKKFSVENRLSSSASLTGPVNPSAAIPPPPPRHP